MTRPDAAPPPLALLHVEDHALVREAVAAVLAAEPDVRVTGAGTPAAALAAAREHRPGLVLLDVEYTAAGGAGHCFEFVGALLDAAPAARVLFYTGRPTENYVLQARRLSAARPGRVAGFVSKEEGFDGLLAAVRAAAAGGAYAESPAAAAAADRAPFLARLTPTQLVVLAALVAHPDMPYKQLAKVVNKPESTLKKHVEAIQLRTDCHEKPALVARAMRAGLGGPV